MPTIPLTQNRVAIVDDDDFEALSKHKWHAEKNRNSWYARTSINGRAIRMHRFVLPLVPTTILIDHKNRDGLDNRKKNLVLSNHILNALNSSLVHRSGGVYFNSKHNLWRARFTINLGWFQTENDATAAIKAYRLSLAAFKHLPTK